MRPSARLDKEMVELMHVQRFAADCHSATGVELYAAIESNGEDPPDFFVTLTPGAMPARARKNLEKFAGSSNPVLRAHSATVISVWASSRFTSRTTRSSMNCFALRPTA
jgi:hypothetical protein